MRRLGLSLVLGLPRVPCTGGPCGSLWLTCGWVAGPIRCMHLSCRFWADQLRNGDPSLRARFQGLQKCPAVIPGACGDLVNSRTSISYKTAPEDPKPQVMLSPSATSPYNVPWTLDIWRLTPWQLSYGLLQQQGFSKKAKHHHKEDHRHEEDSKSPTDEDFSLDKVEGLMRRSIEYFEGELANIRTGRATPGMLDHIMVRAYGEAVPLKSLATVSVKDPQLLAATVFDPETAEAVAKAIRVSPLNLSPQLEKGGSEILIPLPRPTREGMEALVKLVSKESEAAKVSIRTARKVGMEEAKKFGGEDDVRRAKADVQKLTDRMVAEVEAIRESKEKAIMSF